MLTHTSRLAEILGGQSFFKILIMPNQQRVEIKKVKTGYRVRYFANNGEILAVSEVLKTLTNARKNIIAMVKLLENYEP